jgi:putative transposase
VRKSRYSEEQIEAAVRQADAGASVAEIVRELGISESTFVVWKKRCGLETPESRELERLRIENLQLKRLVGNLTRDLQAHKRCALHGDKPDTAVEPGKSVDEALMASALEAASGGVRVSLMAAEMLLTSLAVARANS